MGDFNFPKLNWENDLPQDLHARFDECINANDNELISNIIHTEPIGKSDNQVLCFQLYAQIFI